MELRNNMDDKLRKALAGAKSPLPEGMLARILEEQKRKRRIIFWWINAAIIGCLSIIGLIVANYAYTPKEEGLTPVSKTTQPQTPAQTEGQTQTPAQTPAQSTTPSPNPTPNPTPIPPAHTAVTQNTPPQTPPQSQPPAPKPNTPPAKQNDPIQPNPVVNPNPPIAVVPNPTKDTAKNAVQPAKPVTPILPPPVMPPATDPVVIAKVDNPKPFDSFADARAIDLKKPKKENNKPKYNFMKQFKPELYFSLGWVNETQKVTLPEMNPQYTNRDYSKLFKSAVNPLTGAYFAFGLKGNVYKNFTATGGFQFMQTTNKIHYSYKIEEVPVVDIDGKITGYIKVDSSNQYNIEWKSIVNITTIAVPLQFGYSHKLGYKYELCGALGITPQVRFGDKWYKPNPINFLTDFKFSELKNAINVPSTISLGIYRHEGLYTFGITSRINPTLLGATNYYGDFRVDRRRFELGMLVAMKLGK